MTYKITNKVMGNLLPVMQYAPQTVDDGRTQNVKMKIFTFKYTIQTQNDYKTIIEKSLKISKSQ